LDDAVANSGAFREVSGSSTWTGPIIMNGNTFFGAAGSQILQNGVTAATLNVLGKISDAPGTTNTVFKIGEGNVVFSRPNDYKGKTVIQGGVLIANNPTSLGASSAGTTVQPGTALELEANLQAEPITLNGDGYAYNGHFAGSLRNIANNNTYTG